MADGVRLCRLAGAEGGTLCVLTGEDLFPVREVDDLATLIASQSEAETLEELVAGRTGDEPVASLDTCDDRLALPLRSPEVWAAGVAYERSREAREDEADHDKDVYTRVYESDRPELFFKATGWRIVGPRDPVGLRSDSSCVVPEPELGLVLGGRGQILGYVLANDQTGRDIEAANPLYLPQAKIFAGSCAIGPIDASVAAVGDLAELAIELRILRHGERAYEGSSSMSRLRRTPAELVEYLCAENPILAATVLLTGTGIVPPHDFALESGDVIEISAHGLGSLRNPCAPASTLMEAATRG